LHLATELSRQFAGHGLQFFKVNKTYTHVSVARPLFLDLETTPVSENIRRIIGHINANPKCSRRQLVEALAPTPQPAVIEIKPATEAAPPVEGAVPPAPAAAPEPTPEQNSIIADLHWLVHQGHVIEFADGRLETAKKPLPKPPRPDKKAKSFRQSNLYPRLRPSLHRRRKFRHRLRLGYLLKRSLPAPNPSPRRNPPRLNRRLRRPMQQLRKRLNRRRDHFIGRSSYTRP
jgi:hypothetical protein